MSRWKAAAIHLGISFVIASLVFCLIYFVWYPSPLFKGMGGDGLIKLILGIDVVLGPLLTLIVFKTGKKSLKFDLTVIALLQLAALGYGLYATAIARPVFMAYAKDRIVAVPLNALDPKDKADAKSNVNATISWFGPRWVVAPIPTDPKIREELLFAGIAGKDIEMFPQYYQAYLPQASNVWSSAKPMNELLQGHPEREAVLQAWLKKNALKLEQIRYVPLKVRKKQFYTALLIEPEARMVGALEIDPWQ